MCNMGLGRKNPQRLLVTEPSGSRGTQNVPLAQVLTEGPHSPDSLPTETPLDQTIPGIHCGEFLTTHTNTGTRSQNTTVLPKTLQRQFHKNTFS